MKTSDLACLLLVVIGRTAAAPITTTSSNSTSFEIQWGPCPDGSPEGLECGQLAVPLDWSTPTGEQITLGITKVAATNSSSRIGSLIYNPGGPGGAATEFCSFQAAGIPAFSEALTQHFDIICPDPRGVGTSTPITCDPEVWNHNAPVIPTTEQELQQLIDLNKAKGDSCLKLSGDIVKHVDTASVARDLEAIRIALNDGKLNFLGQSYGTQLGSQYAELYPENIRTLVLDGNLDHALSGSGLLQVESSAYENQLDRFFDWCAQNATACGGFEGNDLPKMFDDLIAAANKASIPAPGCLADADTAAAGACIPNVTGHDILFNAQGMLQQKVDLFGGLIVGWEALGLALNQSIADNNATLFSNAIALTNTSSIFATLSIACLDWPRSSSTNLTSTLAEFNERQIMASALNPHVGSSSQIWTVQAACVGWPAEVANPPHVLDQQAMRKTPPILMVNSEHDPSTGYSGALSLKEQIPSAVLLTRDGDGHTTYFLHGDTSALIDEYLVSVSVPVDGTVTKS